MFSFKQGQRGWHFSPLGKVDRMYFVKMIKMAKLTVLCIEDNIANALYLICTSARMEKVGD